MPLFETLTGQISVAVAGAIGAAVAVELAAGSVDKLPGAEPAPIVGPFCDHGAPR